ncbi:MAG: hypothetical protein JNM26_16745 [Ideonella sp.]|nr:hypothetical protein [Ideonella sp.]
MQISSDQVRQLARERAQARARHWSARVDAEVDPAERQDPQVRLATLARSILADLPEDALFEAADLRQTTRVLAQALRAGAPWNDTRAAAQLHGAAALGSLWYMDDRLLDPPDQFVPDPARPEALVPLLAEPQGQRFKRAAVRAGWLGAGLRMALHRALAQQCSDTTLHHLVRNAFPSPDDADDGDEADAEQIGELPEWPADARDFIARARDLQAQAGVTDPVLSRLCLAGDLAFGLGRCVRLLASAPARPPAAAVDFLTEVLHAATRHQP